MAGFATTTQAPGFSRTVTGGPMTYGSELPLDKLIEALLRRARTPAPGASRRGPITQREQMGIGEPLGIARSTTPAREPEFGGQDPMQAEMQRAALQDMLAKSAAASGRAPTRMVTGFNVIPGPVLDPLAMNAYQRELFLPQDARMVPFQEEEETMRVPIGYGGGRLLPLSGLR